MVEWIEIFKATKILRENAPYKSLSIIMLDSVIKAKKKLHSQTLLEECKYWPKKIKMENLINEDLKKSSSDELDNDSNYETESDNEKDNEWIGGNKSASWNDKLDLEVFLWF